MATAGDSEQRSEEELGSLTPRTRSDDWAATTGRIRETIRSPGTHVGPYIVLDQLGLGGMGVVYAAYDPKLDRKIALKVLRAEGYDETGAIARLRLVSEGRALARVSHPNVVTVHDVGTVESEVYVAMELVEGQTLTQWRREGARSWPEVVEMFLGIASGLTAVHEASLVHRDVKPDNILVDAEGRPRVTDFGLARPEADAPEALQRREQALINANVPIERLELTQTGAKLGTPAYMACEQLNGNPATAHSDQFAFCVTLWETLYGQRPFEGGSWVSLVMSVTEGQIREPPAPPSGRPVPAWLRRIVERGLNPDPDARWPSMRALREALAAGDPQRTRRIRVLGVGAVAVLAAGVGGTTWQRERAHDAALAGCRTEAERAFEIWSEPRRAQLRANFAASSIEGAMGIESSVESVLDTFADAWAQQREEVCVARLPEDAPALLARRADCLEQRLSVMDALLETLTEGDDIIVSRARRSAETLTDLDMCEDEKRLGRMPPPPQDPGQREKVREVQRALMQTLVDEHVGTYDEGLQQTRSGLKEAQRLDHQPLLALAHYRVAVFEEKLGNYEAAVEHWAASFREASLTADDDLAAQAAGALAFAEGFQLGRHDAGIRWSELAGILLERLHKTETLDEARRLDILAVLTESKGQLDEAVDLHRRSIALRESLVPSTHQSIGYGLANLAGVLQNKGDLDGAEDALLRSRAIFESAFGPDNPTTAHVLNNLAGLYHAKGRYAQARALHQQVLEIWGEHLGPDHPDVGDVHRALGDTALAQGELAAAVGHYEDALRVHAQAEGTGQHVEHAKTALRLAEALALRDDPDAGRHFEACASAAGPEHTSLRGRAQLGLGWLAYDRGELEGARVHFERARGLFAGGQDEQTHGRARAEIGLAATALSADADADASASTWRRIADDDAQPPSVRAEALIWLANAGRGRDDDEDTLAALLAEAPPEQALRLSRRRQST